MKTLLMGLMMTSTVAFAADGHQPLSLNFNQEIEQSTTNANDLSNDVDSAMAPEEKADKVEKVQASAAPTHDADIKAAQEAEAANVSNFVDFEIQSVGPEKDASVTAKKQPVDRRYNSVDEPTVELTQSK